MSLNPINDTQGKTIPEFSEVKASAEVEEKANSASGISSNSTSTVKLTQYASKEREVKFQQQLQNTYCFSEKSAKDICSFVASFGKGLDKIDIQPTFRTKIKSLIAKIFKFFGNDTKANQLQQDAFKLFKAFKNEVVKPLDFVSSLPEINCESSLNGLYWILSPGLMALAKGNFHKIPQVLKTNEMAKQLFADDILSVTQEQFLESLKENLARNDSQVKFSKICQIFKDLDRGYAITFIVGNRKISVNLEHKMGIKSFEILQEQLKTLLPEDAKKIQDFCQRFSTQGVFANIHPNGIGVIHAESNGVPTFTVTFSKEDQAIVNVKAEGENSEATYPFDGTLIAIPTETECEFSFHYNLGDGSGSNVQVKEFQQKFHMERMHLQSLK